MTKNQLLCSLKALSMHMHLYFRLSLFKRWQERKRIELNLYGNGNNYVYILKVHKVKTAFIF